MAIQDCDESLERIYKLVSDGHDRADHHVVINFGVNAGSRVFCLENIGKNYNNFCIPDERGNQPQNCPIDQI